MDGNGYSYGKVIKLESEKGFGFVSPDGVGLPDHFFHRSSVTGRRFHELTEGRRVTFVATVTDRGARAEDVRLLDDEP